MTPLDFDAFDVLTFDCFGTLIDWEQGILAALRPVLGARGVSASDEALLESYGRHEAELEGGPYLRYRDVLAGVLTRLGEEYGFVPAAGEPAAFAASLPDWPAFPDTPASLERLATRFKLAAITNCDDDLFAAVAPRLGVELDWVITAQQAGAYKPSHRNFELAFEVIGLPRERILHVAQSLFHDHVPARELGLHSVWIDRRHGRPGAGATFPAEAKPDLTCVDLAGFAELAVVSP